MYVLVIMLFFWLDSRLSIYGYAPLSLLLFLFQVVFVSNLGVISQPSWSMVGGIPTTGFSWHGPTSKTTIRWYHPIWHNKGTLLLVCSQETLQFHRLIKLFFFITWQIWMVYFGCQLRSTLCFWKIMLNLESLQTTSCVVIADFLTQSFWNTCQQMLRLNPSKYDVQTVSNNQNKRCEYQFRSFCSISSFLLRPWPIF